MKSQIKMWPNEKGEVRPTERSEGASKLGQTLQPFEMCDGQGRQPVVRPRGHEVLDLLIRFVPGYFLLAPTGGQTEPVWPYVCGRNPYRLSALASSVISLSRRKYP